MLIYVRNKREEGKHDLVIPLWFPTILIANHISVTLAWVLLRARTKDKRRFLTLGAAYRILHALWRCKLRFPRMPLAVVDSADGTHIRFRF